VRTQEFSSAARQRGLIAILISTFFMWGGFFMVIPLISIHFVNGLGWAATSIGFILAVRQLTQQGLALFGGMLADRIGAKGLICAGVLLRAVGFAGMAGATTFSMLLFTSVVAALGGALFESPREAAIAALTDTHNRARFYSLAGVSGGMGMTLGPLLGALLIKAGFSLVAFASAICFFITFLVMLILLPPVRVATERRNLTYGLGLALRDRTFVLYNLLLMGYWFMSVQLNISLPLKAEALTGTTDSVGYVFALNSILTVLLQYPLLRLAERRMRPLPVLILGLVLMAVGLGSVGTTATFLMLMACVAIFSFGALLAAPSQQTVAAELSNPVAFGSYFGINSLALAFGGGLGNFTGGVLYGWSSDLHAPNLPWLTFCTVGLLAAGGLWWLHTNRMPYARKQAAPPVHDDELLLHLLLSSPRTPHT
jgi:DHA1 family multidrug resistance protein-like MFS transporter